MAVIKTYSVPKTREPFVNTPLIPVGSDPETGAERFFISSWNANVGCTSALVDTNGNSRIYRFEKAGTYAGCGAYSAVLTDPDTIWICSEIAMPLRLTLSTGEYTFFDSGARDGLVFNGMQFDKNSGKFLAVSCQHERIMGLSFDTNAQKTVKLYKDFTPATYVHGGFPNSDGKTYTIRCSIGHSSLYEWNPIAETLTEKCMIDHRADCFKVVYDENGRVYIPYTGWLDTTDYSFSTECMPDREMTWFGRRGRKIYGVVDESVSGDIYIWDMDTGKTELFCSFPDSGRACAALTANGEIIAVNMFGVLYKFDANSGALILTRVLDVCAEGRLDCLIKADETHILGTPYITQRFWLIDTESGEGFDAGRASPGAGEVLRVWNLNEKVYMASYTKGVLTEYDPKKMISFPENPRVVAYPPNAMRPFAHTDDGISLYYSCNHPYKQYGCVLTRYNTITGAAFYSDNPIPNQEITALSYNKNGFLLASSTTAADSYSLEPLTDECYIVKIDPETLNVLQKTVIPHECAFSKIVGAIDEDSYLISVSDNSGALSYLRYSISIDEFHAFDLPQNTKMHIGCGYAGLFLLEDHSKLSLWRISSDECTRLETLIDMSDIYGVHVSGDSILLATPKHVHLLDHALAPYIN